MWQKCIGGCGRSMWVGTRWVWHKRWVGTRWVWQKHVGGDQIGVAQNVVGGKMGVAQNVGGARRVSVVTSQTQKDSHLFLCLRYWKIFYCLEFRRLRMDKTIANNVSWTELNHLYLTPEQDRFTHKYNNEHLNTEPLVIKIPDKIPNPNR